MAQILNYDCETCDTLVEYQDNDMTEYNEFGVCKACWEQEMYFNELADK